MALYELAVLGSPTKAQLRALDRYLVKAAKRFKLKLHRDLVLKVGTRRFRPDSKVASAAIFFGGKLSGSLDVGRVLDKSAVPVLPVASRASRVSKEIPPSLQSLNCVFYEQDGPERVFSALLECVGLYHANVAFS